MKNRKLQFMVLVIISFIVFSAETIALGLAPSKAILKYSDITGPDGFTVTSKIVNEEDTNKAIQVKASGELSQYITILDPRVYSEAKSETEFRYTINMNSDLSPGSHTANIEISEFDMENPSTQGNNVAGLMTINQQLIVEVPYTGKYIDGFLSAYSDNNTINSAVTLTNKGDEDANEVHVTLNIKDPQGNLVITKDKGTLDIAAGQSVKIEDATLMQPGEYTIEYQVNYDEKTATFIKDLNAGEYSISITGTQVDNFILGTIAKFNIKLDSDWNAPITGIQGVITIKDMSGNLVDTISTDNVEIDPKNGAITAYWDTANVRTGKYLISILIKSQNQFITQEYITTITQDQIKLQESKNVEDANSKIQDMIIGFSTISLILIGLAIFLLKKKEAQKRKKL